MREKVPGNGIHVLRGRRKQGFLCDLLSLQNIIRRYSLSSTAAQNKSGLNYLTVSISLRSKEERPV